MSGGKGFKQHAAPNTLIILAASSTTSVHSNSSSSEETHVSQISYKPDIVLAKSVEPFQQVHSFQS